MTTTAERIIAIKPGILVGLHVVIDGGREYRTAGIETEREGRKEITSWQTTRTIRDAAEYKKAEEIRGICRRTVEAACIRTEFGPLCPSDNEAALWDAIRDARRQADAFNGAASYSRILVRVLPARIAATDAEAAYSITAEVRRLIDEMQRGIDKLDPEAIRDACNRARRMAGMLADEQAGKVNAAIDAARKIARDVVRRVEKGGEVAETVLADLKQERSAIVTERVAFLDLETALTPTGEALPAVNVQRFAEVETEAEADPEREPEAPQAPATVPAIEIPDADPEPIKASAADARDLDLFNL